MSIAMGFDESGSDVTARVGGKGVNLARCARAGLPVPPGFFVTTDAYDAFLTASGLHGLIEAELAAVDFDSSSELDACSSRIREAVVTAPVPVAMAAEIESAYERLGDTCAVAVRSSGTAEDLADASFAGLHDTFLHVRGQEAVLGAIRRCWSSLWTSRAIAYRRGRFDDSSQIRMAVVVQAMVDAEVSGVMFTANPISANTDEIVINASWGLGEAVVQGIVTPDEYTVRARRPTPVGFRDRAVSQRDSITLEVRERSVGTKEQRIVRAPAGRETVSEPVPEHERSVLTLSDEQVLELAELGRSVSAHYDHMPQDIEWALAEGRFHLLQSRPITGLEFDWAADMETFQWAPDDPEVLWTHAFTDVVTGPKSPLYYQWVTQVDSAGYHGCGNALGIPELRGPSFTNGGTDHCRPAQLQVHKYYRGQVYHSTSAEKALWRVSLPAVRTPDISPWITSEQRQDVRESGFSYADYVRLLARIMVTEPEMGPWEVLKRVQRYVEVARLSSDVADLADRSSWPDAELQRKLDDQWVSACEYCSYGMIVFIVYAAQMIPLLGRLVESWYDGDNPHAFAELCQGVNIRSKTLEENLTTFDLAQQIRESAYLSAQFAEHKDADFFVSLADSEEGQAFLERYREFVRVHGHRGHEERDFYFLRRYEDPSIDYRNFQLFLSAQPEVGPREQEERLSLQRQRAYDDVIANLREDPVMGSLKAGAFKVVYDWVQNFLSVRDDERWAYEHSVLCVKLLSREVARRCVERGVLDDVEDFCWFTKDELYDALEGKANPVLTRAKAAARRRDFERSLDGTFEFPAYLRDGRPAAVDLPGDRDSLVGTGWTSGTVTATARVVRRLSEIDRVQPGEVLVCSATDPGWTPVFMLISGIVTETGGVLSHATCLAREYGLPSVQLPNARKLIPDGATVEVNGSTGEIVVLDEGSRSAPEGPTAALEPVVS